MEERREVKNKGGRNKDRGGGSMEVLIKGKGKKIGKKKRKENKEK